MTVLLTKVGLAVALTVIASALIRGPRILDRLRTAGASDRQLIVGATVLFRLLPFFIIYLVIRLPAQSDVISVFWPQVESALAGRLVYRDFESMYGPAFPYAASLVSLAWRDPRSIVLLMVVVELGTVMLTYSAMKQPGPAAWRIDAAVFYLALPAPLSLTLIGGQEDIWMWTFGVVLGMLLVARRDLAMGVVAGAGFLVTKVLFLFPVAAILVAARRPLPYLAGLALVGLPAAAVLWLGVGDAMFMPLREEANVVPPNLWLLLNILLRGSLPLGSPWFTRATLCLVLALGCVVFASQAERIRASLVSYAAAWVLLFNAFLLLSPKSLGNYVAMYLLPLVFLAVLRRDSLGLFLTTSISVVATIQPSLWYRLGQPSYSLAALPATSLDAAELALELVAVVLYIAIIQRSWIWLRSPLSEQQASAQSDCLSLPEHA